MSIFKIQLLRRNEYGYPTLTWSVAPPNESKCWLAHLNDSYNMLVEKNIFLQFSVVIVNLRDEFNKENRERFR